LKNRLLLENHFLPGDLKHRSKPSLIITIIGAIRCLTSECIAIAEKDESLKNLTLADVYFGRGQSILNRRERIKQKTIEIRRLQYRKAAA